MAVRILAFSLLALAIAGCSAEHRKARHLKRGISHFEAGEYGKARIEFLNVLKQDPTHVVALSHLGRLWLERGSPLRAAPFLAAVQERDPGDNDVALKLARIKASMGRIADARADCLKILKRAPGHPEAIVALTLLVRSKADYDVAEKELQQNVRHASAPYLMAAANLAVVRGDSAAALTALKKAASADSGSWEVRLATAQLHLQADRIDDAEREFKAAAELSPVRSEGRLNLAEFKLNRRAIPEAVALLSEVTRKAPDYLPAWRALAAAAIIEKRYDDANGFLDKVFTIDSEDPQATIQRTEILRARGEVKAALDTLDRLGKSFPHLASIKYQSALAHLQNRDPARALEAIRAAVAMNPDNKESVMMLAELSLRAGDAETAARVMAQLLGIRPTLVPAQAIFIRAIQSLDKIDPFVQSLRSQLEKQPENASLHFMLGMILNRQGKIAEARTHFEKSLELAPNRYFVVRELITIDIKERRYAEALERAQSLLTVMPNAGSVHLLEARVHAAQGKWDEAEVCILKTLELEPANAEGYQALTYCYLARKSDPAVVARFRNFVSSRPKDLHAVLLGGQVFLAMGEFAAARDVYETYLKANPSSGVILNNLAAVYAEHLQQLDLALEKANTARKLEPGSPEIADTLGWILFRRGEHAAALDLIKEAAEKLPDNAEIQFHLGVVAKTLGRVDEARSAFRRAAASQADFPGKDRIPQYVSELEKN